MANTGRAGPASRSQFERCFLLDDDDLVLIARRRSDAMKLDFAAQLGTVRFLGTFPSDDPIGVPTVVVDYVAELLGIADPSCIKAYTKRPKTAYEQAREIQRTLATAASPGGGGAGRLGGPRGRGTAARPKALFVHWG